MRSHGLLDSLSWMRSFISCKKQCRSPYSQCRLLRRTISTLPKYPIFQALAKHDPITPAIVHSPSERTFSYGNLLRDVAAAKDKLTRITNSQPLRGKRVAFLAENGYDYVVSFLSILALDAIAVPLAQSHPSSELRYILENSTPTLFLSTAKFQDKAEKVLKEDLNVKTQLEILSKIEHGAESEEKVQLVDQELSDGGLMLYTSGTTNRPKGVVLSTSVITAQAKSLIEAWRYSPTDYLLHVLPLHHIHGTVNGLFTPLMAGSSIEFAYPFNAENVWRRLAEPFQPNNSNSHKRPITFFTVVPTIYSRLLSTFLNLDDTTKEAARTALSPHNMRLNISGSAALPTPIKSAWTELSRGNVLLERYGMTEVGMALSCGLDFSDRIDGSVGWPLPSVEVRLVDTETNTVIPLTSETNQHEREGEIQLRGPTIFSSYWNNPTATAAGFTTISDDDGQGPWFKTGDIATRHTDATAGLNPSQPWARGPIYSIRGRQSVDIIKTRGEKVSALEIERELLSLPQIAEAAVVGLKSEFQGQKVAAVLVLTSQGQTGGKDGRPWRAIDVRRALRGKLAVHQIPTEVKVVDQLPRNAMGKINKKTLIRDIWGEGM